jgi:hypothetical protein
MTVLRTLAHLLAALSHATPKQAKEPRVPHTDKDQHPTFFSRQVELIKRSYFICTNTCKCFSRQAGESIYSFRGLAPAP